MAPTATTESTRLLSLAPIRDKCGTTFKASLKEEIDKVEEFFLRKLHDLCDRLQKLAPEIPVLSILEAEDDQSPGDSEGYGSGSLRRGERPRVKIDKPVLNKKEQDMLRRDLLGLYRDFMLLKNFAVINYTAVVKVMYWICLVLRYPRITAFVPKSFMSPQSMRYRLDLKVVIDAAQVDTWITKKFDKRFSSSSKMVREGSDSPICMLERTLRYVHQQHFYKLHTLKEATRCCEEYFADLFCGGDDAQARGLMLPLKTDERIDLAQFQLGYRMGIAAVLAFWIIWDCCFEPYEVYNKRYINEDSIHEMYLSVMLQPAFPLYRALAGLLLLRWCWALSTLVWGRARINYIYLFEIDPRAVSPPLEVFNNVAAETIIYLANLLIYYKLLLHRFPAICPPGCVPFMLCLYVIFQTVYPFRKTWVFWRVILRVLAAPLVKVDFFATYVADVMTSSVKTTQDLAFTACFFLSGDFLMDLKDYHDHGGAWQASSAFRDFVIPALCVLPLWLRFQQCLRRYHDTHKRFPHLANCLKYSMAFTVALFAVFAPQESSISAVKVAWFVLYVVSTLYTFAWDVLQDWGLGHLSHNGLRKKRLFSRKAVYYMAIGADLVLRFNWLYSLIPPGHSHLPFIPTSTLPILVTTVVAVAELLRRTMWGFFRLENEQIHNTEGYRSIRNVPLHFTTETARQPEPRQHYARVIGEVVAVTAAGVAMAAVAVVAARKQGGSRV